MSKEKTPVVIPPPDELAELGPLVVVEGDCAYFHDGRASCTAFALPGRLSGDEYRRAMDLGMRRSGTVVYRPLCRDCRKCQPLRIPLDVFQPSRSQRRALKRCDGMFTMAVGAPTLDEERLSLYARYQSFQHGDHAQSADEKSYRRFLIETVTDTIEIAWRNSEGVLIGVGILDVTPDALSSVYFYWEPTLAKLSLGVYSAMKEIELCRRWKKRYYYLGYLVAGSRTMSYKADFPGAEIWDGEGWVPLGGRGVDDEVVQRSMAAAEERATRIDQARFRLEAARALPVMDD